MPATTTPNLNHLWGKLLVEELIRQEANYFCISPGSRSSPLTMSAASNPKARIFVHFDERASAFHALGYASATLQPAVLICTSGTAAANYFPAVIEASKKKLPLVILTADRPPELRQTGANQTIEQSGLFGEYVRWRVDLPCPTLDIKPEFLLTTVDQAIYRSCRSPAGPVHINCMFREPLEPVDPKEDGSAYIHTLKSWAGTCDPYTSYVFPQPDLQPEDLTSVLSILKRIERGVIVVGKLYSESDRMTVLRLAEKLRWPIFADVTSGLRLGQTHAQIISFYDQILLFQKIGEKLAPDGVLHFGGRMTSKRWYEFIEKNRPRHYVMILNHPLRNDPQHQVTLRVEASSGRVCRALIPSLTERNNVQYLKSWQRLSLHVQKTIDGFRENNGTLNEPMVARVISEHIDAGHGLFLGNSMPVRDMDMYAANGHKKVVIGANRGASGIDGTIATASGFAHGLQKPVTLLLGDLAFLHDLNSLTIVKDLKQPMTIVVINNNGGGIFSFLSVAEHFKSFERLFGTPHHLSFESAGNLFGLVYARPSTLKQFEKEYRRALKGDQSIIIEVETKRMANRSLHDRWQEKIKEALENIR